MSITEFSYGFVTYIDNSNQERWHEISDWCETHLSPWRMPGAHNRFRFVDDLWAGNTSPFGVYTMTQDEATLVLLTWG